MQRCKGCRLVYYCGKRCQSEAWSQHKPVCKRPEERVPALLTQSLVYAQEINQKRGNNAASSSSSSTDKTVKPIVTLDDLDSTFTIIDTVLGPSEWTGSREELRVRDMQIYGRTCPLPLAHADGLVVRSTATRGNGVFATRDMHANVVATFYRCDAIYDCLTMMISVQCLDDGLDLRQTDYQLLCEYQMNFPEFEGARLALVGDPRRPHEKLLLGHMVNDGASYIFGDLTHETMTTVTQQQLIPKLFAYLKESALARNCQYNTNKDCTVLVVETLRAIRPGEELFVTYGHMYWLERALGADCAARYPVIEECMAVLMQQSMIIQNRVW
jgi:MYND finger